MKLLAISIALFLPSTLLFSQQPLEGKVLAADTGQPVDYVNIGIVNKAKGTVSDDDGSFHLVLGNTDINDRDTVNFSRIGYKTLKFSTRDLRLKLHENPIIPMEESLYELEEIVLNDRDAMKNRIGYNSTSKKLFGFWNKSLALGGEHASKIRIKKGPLKLEDLSFNIIASISDSLLVRVNVYEIEGGLPGRNISNRNIIYTISKKRGRVIIDLSPYNIVVEEHFIVSLELLKIYGGKVGIAISAFDDGARSYTRLLSQDRWRKMRKGTTIAFNLNTSLLENRDEAMEASKDNFRERPEEVTILWDNSLSMEDRNLSKELRYLDSYFKNLSNVKVKFQAFGHSLGEKHDYNIKNGKWDALKSCLEGIIYDGATSTKVFEELEIGKYTLLFTDGNRFPEDVNKNWYGTVFTINSKSEANHGLLESIAEESKANYINLNTINDVRQAVDYTGKYRMNQLNHGQSSSSATKFREINGNVSDFDDPITGVTVKVKGTESKTRTDAEGNYVILAKTDDLLEFSYPGRRTIETLVNKSTTRLDITMPLGVKILDEVVVEEKKRLKESNAPLHQIVTTNFGPLDPERTGLAVKQIQGDELNPASQTIQDALQGKFPGVQIVMKYPELIQLVKIRVGDRFYAAWDVDGLQYPPNKPPIHINIHNIKSITIMPGSWAAARYGGMAAGGIVIVRTISQSFDNLEVRMNPLYDQVKLGNNIYQGEAVPPENNIVNQPKYLIEIDKASSIEEAYPFYLEQRERYGDLPHFYLDVHNLFRVKWNAEELANRVLSNIEEQFYNDVNALKAMAYTYEEMGLITKALSVYEIIHTLKSSPQSQRNLANALVKTMNYKKAWSIYTGYIRGKDSITYEGTDKIVRNEMLGLVENHSAVLGLDATSYTFEDKKDDIGLIVEWNNPNAQFELQFVGPERHYYTWNSAVETPNEDVLKGQTSIGFDIEDIGKGPWMINVKYLGNQENTPSYLKFTVRDNKKRTETVKVLKLLGKNVNYRFLSISSNEVVVAN